MLSILIPTYNYNILPLVQMLHKECISLGINYEIIVADDSPESPFNVENRKIEAFPNCIFLQNETNLGRTLTRKKLAETAHSETLLFLDADVMPASENFVKNYLSADLETYDVIFGGYAYNTPYDKEIALRLKYGKQREEKSASIRNTAPHAYIFSGNLLITKTIFLQNNYSEHQNLYGLDNFFNYSLYKNNVSVLHLDNPIYHLGLEGNTVFFKKCLESVEVRKKLLADAPGIENINSLLRHYKNVRRYKLDGLVSAAFRLGEPFLKKMILKPDPNLFCLDIYRLGYICSLK